MKIIKYLINNIKKIMNEEKNQNETKIEEVDKTSKNKKEIDIASKQKTPQMRQILIETNGNMINLVKNETVGSLELIAVLSSLLNAVQNRKQQ